MNINNNGYKCCNVQTKRTHFLKLLTSVLTIFFSMHKITFSFFYSALCLTNLTIKNGRPNPVLKNTASKAVNLYLLLTSKGKLEPGPP